MIYNVRRNKHGSVCICSRSRFDFGYTGRYSPAYSLHPSTMQWRKNVHLTKIEWRIYASINYAIPSSDNCLATSNYLNQCYNIINWSLMDTLHSNRERNSHILIQENSVQNVVWKLVAILFRYQCDNTPYVIASRHTAIRYPHRCLRWLCSHTPYQNMCIIYR